MCGTKFHPHTNIYVKKTNKIHLYRVNLFQLKCPLHVSNEQVHYQEAISVHAAYSISHVSVGCPATNMIRIVLAAGHPILVRNI
jgi:hypothetical protein